MEKKPEVKKIDLAGIGVQIKKFLAETQVEAKKVIWPDRKFVTAATIIILIIVFLVAVFVMAIDFGFSVIFKFLNDTFRMRI